MSNTNKILIALIVIVLLLAAGYYFFFMNNDTTNTPAPTPPPAAQVNPPPPPPAATVPDKAIAAFDTSAGKFEITLDGKAAPKTVANFIKLANDGYYEGIIFHRIIEGFMIQGGDPNSRTDDIATWGQGGPGYTVPAEIGLKNNLGAIATARVGDQYNPKRESSGSQFFIVLEESQNNHLALDGQYTVFGYVTKGMDIVSKIGSSPVEANPYARNEMSLPLTPVKINKITITEVK